MIWVIWQLQNGSSRELWILIFSSVQDPSWGGSPLYENDDCDENDNGVENDEEDDNDDNYDNYDDND